MGHELSTPDIIAQKLDQAADALRESGADLWLTFVQETSAGAERIYYYISPGHLTWESLIAVTPSGERFLICGRFDQQVFEASRLFTEVITFVQDFREPFEALMARLKPRRVAVNFSMNDTAADGIPHGRFLYLEELLKSFAPGAQVVSAESIIGALISQKSPKEQAHLQAAVTHTVGLFEDIGGFLRPGRTEKEIYDFVQGRMAAKGLTPSFQTLVFAGDRGAGMGHGAATDNAVRECDLVHVDMGVFVGGYASDMQRTWYVRKPGETTAPESVQKGFDTIVRAIDAAAAVLRPGIPGTEADAAARAVVVGAGYPEYPHALGHQLGRHAHDGGCLLGPRWPRYKNTILLPVRENQIFTLEPSLNVPGFGAVGIEEDVLITRDGPRFFAEPQRELWFV
ncbi:MAG: M24 family metallopeptidase [Acidobacteriota bacterium]